MLSINHIGGRFAAEAAGGQNERKKQGVRHNVRVYLNKREMEPEQLAKRLGYSEQEVRRIMDARLFLTAEEKEQIAAELGVTVGDLYEPQEDLIYENAGCYECRGEFSEPSNKEILTKQLTDAAIFFYHKTIKEILNYVRSHIRTVSVGFSYMKGK